MDQMIMCNVKAVTSRDKPTENNYPSLQFPSTLRSILVSCSLLFWFLRPTTSLFCYQLVLVKKALINPLCLRSQHQTVDMQNYCLSGEHNGAFSS